MKISEIKAIKLEGGIVKGNLNVENLNASREENLNVENLNRKEDKFKYKY